MKKNKKSPKPVRSAKKAVKAKKAAPKKQARLVASKPTPPVSKKQQAAELKKVAKASVKGAKGPVPQLSADEKAKLKAKGLAELITLGKEKGFLTYDQINKILPAHVISSDEIDDVLVTLNEKQIDVVD